MRQIPDVPTALGIYPWLRLLESGVGERFHTIWLQAPLVHSVWHHTVHSLSELLSPDEMLARVPAVEGHFDAHTVALLVDPKNTSDVTIISNRGDNTCEDMLRQQGDALEGKKYLVYASSSSHPDVENTRHMRVVVIYPRNQQSFADLVRKHEE